MTRIKLKTGASWVEHNGDEWWVKLDDETTYCCTNQDTAQILSMLAEINERLKKVSKK